MLRKMNFKGLHIICQDLQYLFFLWQMNLNFTYIKFKVRKILVLLMLWNPIYWIKNVLFKKTLNFSGWLLGSIFPSENIGSYNLWFFWALIITLMIDLIIYKLKILGFRIEYIVAVLFLLNILIYQFNWDFEITQVFRIHIWAFYSAVGGYLGNVNLKKINNKKIIGIIFISGITGYIYIYTNTNVKIPRLAEYNYDWWIFILYTISFFIVLSSLNYKDRFIKLIEKIIPLTMGVYIVHVEILKVVSKITQNLELRFIMTLFGSFILVYILMKIKYLNKIVQF